MARVMKSRYFPNTLGFLAIEKQHNWLKKGVDGNGSSMKVWEDDWFSKGPFKRLVIAKPEGCTLLKA